jgi:16S rRNA (guanine1516-N2)-methyltransferase
MIHNKNIPLFVSFEEKSLAEKARLLAETLQLPLLKEGDLGPLPSYILCVTLNRLELRLGGEKGAKTKIFAEFIKGPQGYRRRCGGGLKSQIAKAVGLKSRAQNLSILDATAGLGQDAFVLATLGCRVLLVERSPIICALLKDGLARAEKDPEIGAMVSEYMTVLEGDAKVILENIREDLTSPISPEIPLSRMVVPDVVYLDPMFPKRTKTALTKIEMRVIRDIVGEDEDAAELLLLAKKVAALRVVVKRPRSAPPIAGLPPNFVVEGQRNRYDVYLSLRAKVTLGSK